MFAILLSEKMDPFYQNIASFPTVFFTFLLVLVVLYWLAAVLGIVDIDALDFDLIPHPDVDLVDLNTESGTTTPDVLAGLMLKWGLVGVPVTIIISIISLFGWIICYYCVHFLFGFVPEGALQYLAGIPVLLVSIYLAVMITAFVIRPLRPLFINAQQETVKHVLGQSAVVRTSRVDNGFGEAVLEDGGAGLILKVRTTGSERFEKGDRVVLFEHLEEQNTYRVVSEETFLGRTQ